MDPVASKVMQKWGVNRFKNNKNGGRQDWKSIRIYLYNMVQKCQMTDFGEQLDQLYAQLYLELMNWIKLNTFIFPI